jgi:hypothetical protein
MEERVGQNFGECVINRNLGQIGVNFSMGLSPQSHEIRFGGLEGQHLGSFCGRLLQCDGESCLSVSTRFHIPQCEGPQPLGRTLGRSFRTITGAWGSV